MKQIALGSGDSDLLLPVSVLPDKHRSWKLFVPCLLLWMKSIPEKASAKQQRLIAPVPPAALASKDGGPGKYAYASPGSMDVWRATAAQKIRVMPV